MIRFAPITPTDYKKSESVVKHSLNDNILYVFEISFRSKVHFKISIIGIGWQTPNWGSKYIDNIIDIDTTYIPHVGIAFTMYIHSEATLLCSFLTIYGPLYKMYK